VLSAIAFLEGLTAQELRCAELDHRDPAYEVVIAIRAVKPAVAKDTVQSADRRDEQRTAR
jgi:hypothetical protein